MGRVEEKSQSLRKCIMKNKKFKKKWCESRIQDRNGYESEVHFLTLSETKRKNKVFWGFHKMRDPFAKEPGCLISQEDWEAGIYLDDLCKIWGWWTENGSKTSSNATLSLIITQTNSMY